MKKEKKPFKLYNMIIPPYVITLFSPLFILLCLAGNFLIDSFVMLMITWAIYGKIDLGFYKKRILKAWLLGFAADIAGLLFMLIFHQAGYHLVTSFPEDSALYPVFEGMHMITTNYNIYSVIFLVLVVVIAAAFIYLFNYFITFRGAGMNKKQRVLSSLAFAVFTAPYTLLLPLERYAELFSPQI